MLMHGSVSKSVEKLEAVLHTTITGWLQWAHQKVSETSVYSCSKQFKSDDKTRFAAWFN